MLLKTLCYFPISLLTSYFFKAKKTDRGLPHFYLWIAGSTPLGVSIGSEWLLYWPQIWLSAPLK